jgi:hypothetical protein
MSTNKKSSINIPEMNQSWFCPSPISGIDPLSALFFDELRLKIGQEEHEELYIVVFAYFLAFSSIPFGIA